MAFTAKDVVALREKTGVGMMDCKKALTETDGDMEKAIDILREKGLAAAAKKSGRIAAEGMVYAYVDDAKKVGVVVEVNSETDFVAKNADFQAFVKTGGGGYRGQGARRCRGAARDALPGRRHGGRCAAGEGAGDRGKPEHPPVCPLRGRLRGVYPRRRPDRRAGPL